MISRKVYFFFMFMLIYFFLCTCPAYATTDSNTDSYVKKVYNCNFADLFDKYCELALVQNQLLSSIQGKTLDSDTKKSVDLIVDILEKFDRINSLSESDDVDDHIEAMNEAFTIQQNIESLEGYKMANDEGYPLLLSIAIERYFKKEGTYFQEIASQEKNTYNRATYLEKSALAYKNGGRLNLYSELIYVAENEKQIYSNDMEVASSLTSEGDSFLATYENKGTSSNSGFVSDFLYHVNIFTKGNVALESNMAAIELYEKHRSEEEISNTAEKNEQIVQTNLKAFSSVLSYMGMISFIYIVISIYICSSIMKWNNEIKNADSGDELLEGLFLV